MSFDQAKIETLYQNEVLPLLLSQEPYRKKVKFKYEMTRILALSQFILPSVLLFVITYLFPNSSVSTNIGLYFTLVALYSLFVPIYLLCEILPKIEREFLKQIKVLVVTKILKIFNDIKWSYNSEIITKEELYNAGMTLSKDFGLNFDDEFVGKYKDVEFRIGDSRLFGDENYGEKKRVCYNEDSYLEKRAIDAVLILIKTSKFVKDRVVTKERKHWYDHAGNVLIAILIATGFLVRTIHDIAEGKMPIWAGIVYLLFVAWFFGSRIWKRRKDEKRGLRNVALEDVEFLKQFTLEAGNQVESRYLMTTSFVERLKKLKKVFGATKVECRCWDDNVLFVLYTKKNLFEFASLHKPLSDLSAIKLFYQELQSVYAIIDYFMFDKNTKL